MRMFLAIDLDDAAREAASAWAATLSARMGAPAAREVKWVEAVNLHLTLHFFGELSEERLGAVRSELRTPAFDMPAFELALTGAGTFPPTGSTRVVWLGVRERASARRDAMQAMYGTVEARLATLGLQERSARGFTPHLTVGRVRTPGAAVTRALREALGRTPAPSSGFLVSHLTLYQSKLSPKGPTYLPIDRFALPA